MSRVCSALIAPFLLLLLAANGNEKARLMFDGLGDVRIGMTADQAKTLGFSLTTSGPWGEEGDADFVSCHYLDSAPDYPDIHLMINDNHVVRIDVFGGDWQSLSGARLGMSKSQLRKIYGNWLQESLHPYGGDDIDEWAYLTLSSADGKHGAVFEIVDRKISTFRMGTADSVRYIEGCA